MQQQPVQRSAERAILWAIPVYCNTYHGTRVRTYTRVLQYVHVYSSSLGLVLLAGREDRQRSGFRLFLGVQLASALPPSPPVDQRSVCATCFAPWPWSMLAKGRPATAAAHGALRLLSPCSRVIRSVASITTANTNSSMNGSSMSAVLANVQVLAMEQAVAAPFCTARLAALGARVIKVERPGVGDFGRGYDGYLAEGELSSYFGWLNRGKQSLEADAKSPEDAQLLRRVLAKSDVFVQVLTQRWWRRQQLVAGSGISSRAVPSSASFSIDLR
jgi:hypothetical protein